MFFNYRLFIRQLTKSVFQGKNRYLRKGPKRIRFLIFFLILFPFIWLFTYFCFLADHLLFGAFRKQPVEQPVFILGNFRCGSTMLQRLLAKDTRNFTSIRSWEIYTAPSIAQRKFLRGVKIVDRVLFNGKMHNRLLRWEAEHLKQIKIHPIGIHEPEEDEGLFFIIWYSLFLWFFFPADLESCRFDRFDSLLPAPVKKRIMQFYKSCIRRHVYSHGGKTKYLSKNPSHTGRVDSLLRTFPDAHIIYLYREPERMITSTMSWFAFAMHYFADLQEKYPHRQTIMEMAEHFYRYPPERLRREGPERYVIIDFNELTGSLEKTVKMLYSRFGLSMNGEFKKILRQESDNSKTFSSGHSHSSHGVGLDTKELSRHFESMMEFLKSI